MSLHTWEKGTNIKAVLMKLQETNEYKWQASILLKIFKALCVAGRKCTITGIFSTKNKILEMRVSPFYEQSLDFAETVIWLYVVMKHESTAPTPKTQYGLMILPRDTWWQPLKSQQLITVSWNKNVFHSWHMTHFELNQKMCYILYNIYLSGIKSVNIKITIFWDRILFRLVHSSLHLRRHFLPWQWKAAGSSKTMILIYHITWRDCPEDHTLILTAVITSNLIPVNIILKPSNNILSQCTKILENKRAYTQKHVHGVMFN
jgi:hypothetical protein